MGDLNTMAINIGTKPSPHEEAAQAIEGTVETAQITEVPNKEPTEEITHHETTSEPVQMNPTLSVPELIDVAVAFKMPVAQYTMLEFRVRRVVPFDPDVHDAEAVFEMAKEWVEGKLNAIIAEQQNHAPEG